jgi:putative addiction module component (TIGR02574 family)
MAVSLQEIMRLAADLSFEERATLVNSLLCEQEREQVMLEADWRLEVRRRLQAWRDGTEPAVDADEVISKARALLKGTAI